MTVLDVDVTVPCSSGADVWDCVCEDEPSRFCVVELVAEEPSAFCVVVEFVWLEDPSSLTVWDEVVVVVDPSGFSITVSVSVVTDPSSLTVVCEKLPSTYWTSIVLSAVYPLYEALSAIWPDETI